MGVFTEETRQRVEKFKNWITEIEKLTEYHNKKTWSHTHMHVHLIKTDRILMQILE
jgi:hypothetical protein